MSPAELDKEEKKNDQTWSQWMREYWRPVMAIQYLVVCVFDFVLAPIAWTALQAHTKVDLTQWVPTTLGSGGTYHLAMGAVLGVAAWTRSRDKEDGLIRTAYNNGFRDSTYYPPRGSLSTNYQDDPVPRKPLQGME